MIFFRCALFFAYFLFKLINSTVFQEMEDHVEALRLIVRHMEENLMVQEKEANRKFPPSLAVIEETPLLESSVIRNDSATDSVHSDEAPADPMAPTK